MSAAAAAAAAVPFSSSPCLYPRLSIRCDYCSALDTDRDRELPETAGAGERHKETRGGREEREGERQQRSTALSLPALLLQ